MVEPDMLWLYHADLGIGMLCDSLQRVSLCDAYENEIAWRVKLVSESEQRH